MVGYGFSKLCLPYTVVWDCSGDMLSQTTLRPSGGAARRDPAFRKIVNKIVVTAVAPTVIGYLGAVSEGAKLGALVAFAVAVDLVLVVGAPAPVGQTAGHLRGTVVGRTRDESKLRTGAD